MGKAEGRNYARRKMTLSGLAPCVGRWTRERAGRGAERIAATGLISRAANVCSTDGGLTVPPRRPLICCVAVLVRCYRRALPTRRRPSLYGGGELASYKVGTRGPEVVTGRRPVSS
ncbi:hypothetical protein MRX96_019064 [Rhipicephalus microplus]